jgi:hypothetical protein
MSLLMAYEDHYCIELDRTIRRVVQKDGALAVPREWHSVGGVTNFRGFARNDWQRFRDQGFPKKGKPRPRAVLCIADADAVVAQLAITARSRPYHEWLARAEDAFTKLLREGSDRPEQIHGVLLRWNLESTLIAACDDAEAMRRLAGVEPLHAARLDEFLRRCTPDPRTVDDDAFTDTFEDSQRCLAELGKRMGWRKLKKGDRRKDDALTWMTKHRLDTLVRRVPDLERIAQRVRQLALAL